MDTMELKAAWDVFHQHVLHQDTVEKDVILASVHHKSKSKISKIKRQLQLKFLMGSISLICATTLAVVAGNAMESNPLAFVFTPKESLLFFSSMALAIALVLYHNFRAYAQIKAIQSSVMNLKGNLEAFIATMERAITFNIYSDTLLTPIIFTWIYYAYAFKDSTLGYDLPTALLFVWPLVTGVSIYFLQRFMQHLKFGKYLAQLRYYLDMLKKNENKL
ncbi:hypothetical protein [Flagellimonas sp.]|uniref:hypothetical protein n=1 Tax=Flagellimonas sp. TaxID=2058762 RepID=UPI003C7B07D9